MKILVIDNAEWRGSSYYWHVSFDTLEQRILGLLPRNQVEFISYYGSARMLLPRVVVLVHSQAIGTTEGVVKVDDIHGLYPQSLVIVATDNPDRKNDLGKFLHFQITTIMFSPNKPVATANQILAEINRRKAIPSNHF